MHLLAKQCFENIHDYMHVIMTRNATPDNIGERTQYYRLENTTLRVREHNNTPDNR